MVEGRNAVKLTESFKISKEFTFDFETGQCLGECLTILTLDYFIDRDFSIEIPQSVRIIMDDFKNLPKENLEQIIHERIKEQIAMDKLLRPEEIKIQDWKHHVSQIIRSFNSMKP